MVLIHLREHDREQRLHDEQAMWDKEAGHTPVNTTDEKKAVKEMRRQAKLLEKKEKLIQKLETKLEKTEHKLELTKKELADAKRTNTHKNPTTP